MIRYRALSALGLTWGDGKNSIMNYAGFKYTEREVPLDKIRESSSQPSTRNEMDHRIRQALMKDIATNGLKDRIDAIIYPDGTIEVIEGHGRVAAYLALGFKSIPAKVYEVTSEEERSTLRAALFEAARTTMKMTGSQWVEYYYLETQGGNVAAGTPRGAKNVVEFLNEAFSPTVARGYILGNQVGPAQLNSARGMARSLLGLNEKGKYPETDDAHRMLVNCFRWVVKHGMSRAVIEWKSAGKGHAELRRLLDADQPIPTARKRRSVKKTQAQADL